MVQKRSETEGDGVKLLEQYIENAWNVVQKAIEESGENGRKHVMKKAGQSTVKTYKREESNHRKREKKQWKLEEKLWQY